MTSLLSRRNFLCNSAATAAVGLAAMSTKPRLFAAEEPSGEGMRFGLVTYLWGKDFDLPSLLTACEEAQVFGVELRTEHKHGVEPSLSPAQREEVKKRFEDSPVELVGYGSNCEYHADDPKKLQANIELTKRYIELMHDCGGTGVKVKPNAFVKGVPHEKTIEQIGKALNEVAEYGESYGQRIRVEVHGSGTSELPVIRDIFQVADHSNAYVCWNSNGEDLKGEGLEANFRMVQKRFGDTVHVRELNLGDYPYDQLMKLFMSIRYEGWILLEARTNPADKVAAMIEQKKVFESMLG